jgi:hypothetical protein
MQHYGTPTRLLDWTQVLGIALYFAVLGVDEFREKTNWEIRFRRHVYGFSILLSSMKLLNGLSARVRPRRKVFTGRLEAAAAFLFSLSG